MRFSVLILIAALVGCGNDTCSSLQDYDACVEAAEKENRAQCNYHGEESSQCQFGWNIDYASACEANHCGEEEE
jgi:hypothetical protein